MNKLAVALCLVLSMTSLPACNTVWGTGKDIEKGGQAIGRAAK